MAYGDLDKKATEKYTPSRVLKKIAERHGANLSNAKSESEARKLIDEAKEAKAKEADTKPKTGEVLPPLRNGHDHTMIHPQVVFNVPSIHADIVQNEAPAWWDCVAHVKDAALWMVLGAAVYATVGRYVGF